MRRAANPVHVLKRDDLPKRVCLGLKSLLLVSALLLLSLSFTGCRREASVCKPASPSAPGEPFVPQQAPGFLTDHADSFSAAQEEKLERRAREFEARTGELVYLLTVPDLHDEPIDDFSLRVGNAWCFGGRADSEGLLISLAPNERFVRIEVSHGLESSIPDEVAKRIIENRMIPRFRQEGFENGLHAGIEALETALLRPGYFPAEAESDEDAYPSPYSQPSATP